MNKKNIKYILIFVIILLIFIFSFLIYKNLFAESNNTRNSDISEYELPKSEIKSIEDNFKKLEEVNKVEVNTFEDVNSRRLSIVVVLNSDLDFEKFKQVSNEVFSCISDKYLNYYSIHISVDVDNVESNVYPKMGSSRKVEDNGNTKFEFSWSR